MKFVNLDKRLNAEEVSSLEEDLRISFPGPLRRLFLENNGGEPEPYVYHEDQLYTVVNETLPLVSQDGRGTAIDTYENLVLGKRIVPVNFFPFAIDAGGDYFFVDCEGPAAPVFFYRSDSILSDENCLLDLGVSLDEFWERLVPEE